MASVLLIFPELHGDPSLLRGVPPSFSLLAERSEVGVLAPINNDLCFEMACLGTEAPNVPDGPLAVAALGFDPPARSVHYRLAPMSLSSAGYLTVIRNKIPGTLYDEVFRLCEVLETRRLKLLRGIEDISAVVLEEGSPEGITFSPEEADGKPLKECLPMGEDEEVLRRFIDDSANILLDSEFNKMRADEELEPISILWPWGGGFRPICANLSLRIGPISVITGSFRMAGSARICGLRSHGLDWVGSGVNVAIGSLRHAIGKESCAVYVDSFRQLRAKNMIEECDWLFSELVEKLIVPLSTSIVETGGKMSVVSPGVDAGLWMVFAPKHPVSGNLPFDERAIDSSRQNRRTMSELLAQIFGGLSDD